jgi:hypothetical protein
MKFLNEIFWMEKRKRKNDSFNVKIFAGFGSHDRGIETAIFIEDALFIQLNQNLNSNQWFYVNLFSDIHPKFLSVIPSIICPE